VMTIVLGDPSSCLLAGGSPGRALVLVAVGVSFGFIG
jgi:hypothetical protein